MSNRAARGVAAVFLVSTFSASVAHADRTIAVEVAASSTAKGKNDKFAAWRAVDGSTGTAWCEGKGDEGLDETLKLTLAEPIVVTRIDLYVGLHGSAKAYKENNRPSKLFAQTAVKTGEPMVLLAKAVPIVSDHDKLVKLDLKTPRTVQVLELGLAGVTRGDKTKVNQTCVTDVSVVGEKGEVIAFAYGMPVDAMKSLPAGLAAVRAAVAACDEKALAAAVKFPLSHSVAAEEDSRTVKLKNAKALAKACKAGDFPKIPDSADRAGISPSGPGRVTLETDSDTVIRVDMVWNKGAWQLAAMESY
ncbi:MAG: discoidin domain-containing protein [Kofleriaceae bacterium]|nr:MAG: discoidin domain-containing protein [Kofleriaceae bacterium]MBZ0231661.1 discoidin domain-containing protein [Kofleriaceae bacterium]